MVLFPELLPRNGMRFAEKESRAFEEGRM